MNMEGCVWSWDRIACDWCSVIKSSPALCHPMDCSTPGFSVLHYLLEFAQTHALCQWCYPSISSSVDPFSSCLLSFPASGSFLVNQFFASGNFSFSISPSNEYSGLISFSWLVWSCSPRDSWESSPPSQFKSINSSALSFLYGPDLTSMHDYWKNHSFD